VMENIDVVMNNALTQVHSTFVLVEQPVLPQQFL